ncbi:hypothetical protein F7X37_00301 [Candidatus Ecksteinia adelgidicola]|nr:hypothetical protein F7X37_00301 [Candidatus Ecksteinia adelgidicola]
MRKSYPKLLNVLFEEAFELNQSSLFTIKKHIQMLLKLNLVLKKVLPTKMHPWCRIANVRDNILILEVANASWMINLRYKEFILLSNFKKKILPSLLSINIRINPNLIEKK